jgi:glycosyltransferase involved in cell wall biosynthesis
VSQDIYDYLGKAVGVPENRRSLIPNGVDTEHFSPASGTPKTVADCPFVPGEHWLVGTIGRLQTVKNQPALARAFVRLLKLYPAAAQRLRLVIIGEGPLRSEVEKILADGDATPYAWLPGARGDVADILRMLDCFVLPSQAEGTSCTLQEAMACGLPVVATAVGGTPDLVEEGITGYLVKPDDDSALTDAIWRCYVTPQAAESFGCTARSRALDRFALDGLIRRYEKLFTGFINSDLNIVTHDA